MKTKALLLAVLAVAPASWSTASAAPMQAAQENVALEVGRLFAPPELMLASAAKGFDEGFSRSIADDQNLKTAEKRYPGLTAAVKAAARGAVLEGMKGGIGDLQAQAAALFGREFTPVEQSQLLEFMRSSTGRKLVSLGDQVYDTDKLVGKLATDSNTKLTQQDVAAAQSFAFIGKMTEPELMELVRFSATPTGGKFRTVLPKVQALMASWTNDLVAKQQQPIQAAVMRAMRTHIAGAGK